MIDVLDLLQRSHALTLCKVLAASSHQAVSNLPPSCVMHHVLLKYGVKVCQTEPGVPV